MARSLWISNNRYISNFQIYSHKPNTVQENTFLISTHSVGICPSRKFLDLAWQRSCFLRNRTNLKQPLIVADPPTSERLIASGEDAENVKVLQIYFICYALIHA